MNIVLHISQEVKFLGIILEVEGTSGSVQEAI